MNTPMSCRMRAQFAYMLRVLVVALLLWLPTVGHARVVMVCVGINDYPGVEYDLKYARSDAESIHKLFRCKEPLIADSAATVAKITATMDRVFSQATANDVVVFYFSGHGYQGGFYVYGEFLPYEQVYRSMSRSKAHSRLIICDACYSGKMRMQGGQHKPSTKKFNFDAILFLSSRGDQYSYERPDVKHSAFTYYLRRGLMGKADSNADKKITPREIFKYVHDNVVRTMKKSNINQEPVMWGNFKPDKPLFSY